MAIKWEEYIEEHPNLRRIVEAGLDKFGTYKDRVDLVPAYVLAMGVSFYLFYIAR